SDRVVHRNEVAEGTWIIDAISGAKHSLALSKPRHVPAQSDRGSDVVHIVPLEIDRQIRMVRILAHKLNLSEIRTSAGNTDCARAACTTKAGQSALVVSDDSRIKSTGLIGLSIVIPVHAQIQRQVRTNFPVIFKVSAELTLELPVELVWNVR